MLTLGELAAAAGVPVTTLRYYDRIGLLVAERGPGQRRRYRPDAVEVLRLVRLLQTLGCSLDEVAAVLSSDAGARDRRTSVAARKLEDAERRLAELTAVTAVLRHLASCLHEVGEESLCRAELSIIMRTELTRTER